MSTAPAPQRIHSIDAVRALALLGILLVHSHDFCNLSGPKVPPPGALDGILNFIYSHFLVTRAFMVFSFLFGLSFFLQMDHATARGQSFLGRFCWRLILLAGFGVVHSFFYCGDILIIFAITGFILVPLWKLPSRIIACLAALCLLQPLALYHALSGTPNALMDWFQHMWSWLGCTGAPNHQAAGFWEIGTWNLRCGIFSSLLFTTYSYRIWDILAMFMLGLLAGRARLFEGPPARLWKVAGVSFALWVGITLFRLTPAAEGLNIATNMWEKAAFVGICTPLLAWVVGRPCMERVIYPLTQMGRCTLTCYIMQSVVMTWLLSGYGLGLRPQLSITGVILIALALYAFQLIFCTVWMRYFRYGPLEGLWRRLTRIGMQKTAPRSPVASTAPMP